MKYLSCLLLVFCLTGHVMSIAEGEKETSGTAKSGLEKSPRKISATAQQDKMNRRNFNVAGANAGHDDNGLLDDDDKRTFTYSYLNYGGYPYISLLKNTAYNVGFNSTQAGLVSLLGNAALALGGLFVLGKTKLLVGNPRPPVISYGRPSYGRPNRPKKLKNFKKKRGQFTFRKRKTSRRPRPVRNHMSRHTPIIVNEPKNVLEPVRPLMLDDVAYDANYDDSNYDDAYFDIGNIDNNLAQRKGPYEFDQSNKRPSNVPEYDPNERRRPQIMIKPGSNKGRPPMQPAHEQYPLPPVVRRERPQQQQQQQPQKQKPYQQEPMSSMEEEMDAYFDNDDEFVSDRPTMVEKNVEKPKSYVDGSISLSPDGKRLRRKTRRQSTTTEAPTTPAATSTTTTASTTQAIPPTTTFVDLAPDFFAQNKPAQVGGFPPQKDEFDSYWSGPNDNSFMNDFGPPGFSRFRTREREAPEGVKRLLIEEKLPKQQQQQQPPRVQRKKVQSGPVVDPSAPGSDPFGRDNKFDPFSDMAKEFDVDNDELIATISKAFDGFSDFKKIEDQK